MSTLKVPIDFKARAKSAFHSLRMGGQTCDAGAVSCNIPHTVRIATWNCYRGSCLERAADLAPLGPDIAVLQECARPEIARANGRWAWFGANPAHGVGIVARRPFRVTPGPVNVDLDHSAFPAIVTGPQRFHVLAVWALPRPTYVRAMLDALDAHDEFLRAAPSVVVGDFNCFAQWRGAAPSKRNAELARRLTKDFRLVSAYHRAPDYDPDVPERPTHFWRWREHHPFHIDYCFVPVEWSEAIRSVHIGAFSEQHWRSDHRPVVVDLDLPPSNVAAAS
jgi:exonuclease III